MSGRQGLGLRLLTVVGQAEMAGLGFTHAAA